MKKLNNHPILETLTPTEKTAYYVGASIAAGIIAEFNDKHTGVQEVLQEINDWVK